MSTKPAENCGVCGDPVVDPVAYDTCLWEKQRLVEHIGKALPDTEIYITMCQSCYDELSEVHVGEIDPVSREDRMQNRKAMDPILAEVPEEALIYDIPGHSH